MRLLIDTHIFLWACSGSAKLPAHTRAAMDSVVNSVWVSAVTAWEIAIKHAAGKLDFPLEKWDELLTRMQFVPHPIQPIHGLEAGRLPMHHHDPFDRMLVAQARLDGLVLVTLDTSLRRYDVTILGAT